MIIELEDYKGNTIGVAHIRENNEDGEVEVMELKNLSLADIELDDYFGTNEEKIRLQLEGKYD